MKSRAKKLLTNELFLAKKSCLTLEEIHNRILQDIDNPIPQWKVGPIIKVSAPLYLEVEPLPKNMGSLLKNCFNAERQEFVITDQKEIQPRGLLLQLKLKWKFEEDHSNVNAKELLEHCRSEDELVGLQQKIAIFQYITELRDRGEYKVHEVYEAMIKIDLKYYNNLVSFGRKLKEFGEGNFKSFLNKRRNKSNEWKQKVTKQHEAKVLQLYRKNYDSGQIEFEMKPYCEKFGLDYISRSSIKRIVNTPRNKVVHGLQRNGLAFIKDHVMSYVEREKPKYKFQVLECDGSRLQLPYRKTDKSKWKVGYLTIYIIMDIASNKILGYWLDDYENKEMILMAFYMMLAKYKYLPAYIRIDRSKPHRSHRFKRFLKCAHDLGMEHKICLHPREKGTVENFFHWFPEKICKKYPIYTGLGPLTKDWNKKPNPENIRAIENSDKLPIRQELEFMIPKMIEEWNERTMETYGKDPNTIHNTLKVCSAKLIQDYQTAFLTWNSRTKESQIRNTISFKALDGLRSYKLKQNENVASIFEQSIEYFWLETEPEIIFVFTKDGKFIEAAIRKCRYPDDPINISEPEREILMKEKVHNDGLVRFCEDQVKKDNENLLDKSRTLTPFSIASGYNGNKEATKEIEDDFFFKHMPKESSKSRPFDKPKKINNQLEKNFVKTKLKRKFNHLTKIDIKDVD